MRDDVVALALVGLLVGCAIPMDGSAAVDDLGLELEEECNPFLEYEQGCPDGWGVCFACAPDKKWRLTFSSQHLSDGAPQSTLAVRQESDGTVERSWQYDDKGRVVRHQLHNPEWPASYDWQYASDGFLLSMETDEYDSREVKTWERDSHGVVLTETNERGFVRREHFDPRGLSVASEWWFSEKMRSETAYELDHLDRVVSSKGVAESSFHYAYEGPNLVRTWRGGPHYGGAECPTSYEYDAQERLVGVALDWNYDCKVDAHRGWLYGPNGRLEEHWDDCDGEGPPDRERYDYDERGLLVRSTFDREDDGDIEYESCSSYDEAGRLLSQGSCAGDALVLYRYNDDGLLSEVEYPHAGTTRYVYDREQLARWAQDAPQKRLAPALPTDRRDLVLKKTGYLRACRSR